MTPSTLSRRLAVSASLYSSGGDFMLNPAFNGYPRQIKAVGSMILGYNELEITFSHIAGLVVGLKFETLAALAPVFSETVKIRAIDGLARTAFQAAGLGEEFKLAYKMIFYCARVRNRYAHCHWRRNYAKKRLEFVESDQLFKPGATKAEDVPWAPITLKLLREQEAYFVATRRWLIWLELTLQEREEARQFAALHGYPQQQNTTLIKPQETRQPPENSFPPTRPPVRKKRTGAHRRTKPAPKEAG